MNKKLRVNDDMSYSSSIMQVGSKSKEVQDCLITPRCKDAGDVTQSLKHLHKGWFRGTADILIEDPSVEVGPDERAYTPHEIVVNYALSERHLKRLQPVTVVKVVQRFLEDNNHRGLCTGVSFPDLEHKLKMGGQRDVKSLDYLKQEGFIEE